MTNSVKRIFASILLLLTIGCGEDEPNPCEGKLKDKSLDVIRYCIQGKWNYYRAVGGINGQMVIYPDNVIYEFKPKDSLVIFDNRTEVLSEKIQWRRVRDIFSDSTYTMRFPGASSKGVWGISRDTLKMYDNGNDGFLHDFIRD